MVNNKEYLSFPAYKGVQRPIMFKSLKGKYIYFAMVFGFTGLIVGFILMATLGLKIGLPVMVIVSGGGIFYCLIRQKRGLHSKNNVQGTFVIKNIIRIN